MDLLSDPAPIDLNDRSWVIHTRTEERPPVRISSGAVVMDSMITDGCMIGSGARVERSVLAPGVRVLPGAVVRESVLLTDAVVERGAVVEHAIVDKRAQIGEEAQIGAMEPGPEPRITMLGKNCVLPPGITIGPGAIIGTDVIPNDFSSQIVGGDAIIQTKRLANEV